MITNRLFVGTFPRALHADAVDVAFGIYRFDLEAQDQTAPALTRSTRPGWLVAHPSGLALYAVNEVREVDGRAGGSVTGYRVDPTTGDLTESARVATAASPCHAAVSSDGRYLVVPTFHGGVVHVFALGDEGAVGPEVDRAVHSGGSAHPVRQQGPHPHAAVFSPDGRFVLIPDLGTDRIEVYRFDDGRLVPRVDAGVALPPGTGPRHLAFHPSGRWVHAVGEMDASVTTLSFEPASGALAVTSTIAVLPPETPGFRSAAEIVASADGGTVYVTHRSHGSSGPRPEGGEDCVVWFAVDPSDGALRRGGLVPSGGAIPRSCLLVDDDRRLLVGNQGSASICVFDVLADGGLAATTDAFSVPVPVCLLALEMPVSG